MAQQRELWTRAGCLLCYVHLIVFKGFDDFLRASDKVSRQGKIVKDKVEAN